MNRPASAKDPFAANQASLSSALDELRAELERHASRKSPRGGGTVASGGASGESRPALTESVDASDRLGTLSAKFSLSPFERKVLLLAAAPELDGRFSELCSRAQGDPTATAPTFGLALAALPGAHWSALMPVAPLRHWRLVHLSGTSPTRSPLQVDERILHYLAGLSYPDPELEGALLAHPRADGEITPSQSTIAERLAGFWSGKGGESWPVALLTGPASRDKIHVASAGLEALGLGLGLLSEQALPAEAGEMESFVRLCDREAILGGRALVLQMEGDSDPARQRAAALFLERCHCLVGVTCRERFPLSYRTHAEFEVSRPTRQEQRELWLEGATRSANRTGSRNAAAVPEMADFLASSFDLSSSDIRESLGLATDGERKRIVPDELRRRLAEAGRTTARPRMDGLAVRIEARAGWDDLVLPDAQKDLLRAIARQLRHGYTVREKWGFAGSGGRGLGVSALFSGASGTGKTLAAEVLANELLLDLYRIDLSQVVSKYVGETEKNLRRVFDAAEAGGSILLFDEADALFGSRSEVKDAHDRYANIEVSYLLSRMETFGGVAILTTNLKANIDPAFLRRLRFVVQFPFPGQAQREAIWEAVFPRVLPREGVDSSRLSRLQVPGGNIRNIALGAAYLAAEAGSPLGMAHLLSATRTECAKMERPLSEAEVAGWVA